MPEPASPSRPGSFLGTGWSFPPEFLRESGQVVLTSDEADIQASLKILLGTSQGERFLNPKYGLDLRELLFEPLSTTALALLKDRMKTAILVQEPRINLVSLDLDSASRAEEGVVMILIEYEVRATNSRYNLVYPFYLSDSSEVGTARGGGAGT